MWILTLSCTDITDDVFLAPRETLEFAFSSSDLLLFDSAWEGDAPDKKAITASIEPGGYKILTQLYHPDERTELVLHGFDRTG